MELRACKLGEDVGIEGLQCLTYGIEASLCSRRLQRFEWSLSCFQTVVASRSSYLIRRRPSLTCRPDGNYGEKRSRVCALAALETLNDEKINQGPKFELVKPLGCMTVDLMGVYHCNFIARPIGGSEADDKLYFAEVELDLWEEELQAAKYGREKVTLTNSKGRFISILGPPGSKTGLYGCRSCNRIRGYIQHPKGVPFRKY